MTLPTPHDAAPPGDPWADQRRHTQARDAVHIALDTDALARDLAGLGLTAAAVRSRAPGRATYLRRPDWGRRLHAGDADRLQAIACGPVDLAVVVGDGLSAVAVQQHAAPLLAALMPQLAPGLSWAPLAVATQARVALAD